MTISATIHNSPQKNEINVSTNENTKVIDIPGRVNGGSSVNGGELLMLALATCFCNDIYREAARRNIQIDAVEVKASGDFAKEGEAGTNVSYTLHIQSPAEAEEIERLIEDVDRIAEIHKTVRNGTKVELKREV